MSVRAYRVKRIDWAEPESFNLWHDKELIDFLDEECNFSESLSGCGEGFVEVLVEVIEKAIREVPMEERQKVLLQKDVKSAKRKAEEFISYYCF